MKSVLLISLIIPFVRLRWRPRLLIGACPNFHRGRKPKTALRRPGTGYACGWMRKAPPNLLRTQALMVRQMLLAADNPPNFWRTRVPYGGTIGSAHGAPWRLPKIQYFSLGDSWSFQDLRLNKYESRWICSFLEITSPDCEKDGQVLSPDKHARCGNQGFGWIDSVPLTKLRRRYKKDLFRLESLGKNTIHANGLGQFLETNPHPTPAWAWCLLGGVRRFL